MKLRRHTYKRYDMGGGAMLSMMGNFAGAIPGVGSAISGGLGLIGGIINSVEAQKQKAKADAAAADKRKAEDAVLLNNYPVHGFDSASLYMAGGGHLNFSNASNYKRWLGYVHANGLAEKTPGNQSISIGGKSHVVKHPDGGTVPTRQEIDDWNKLMTHYNNYIITNNIDPAKLDRSAGNTSIDIWNNYVQNNPNFKYDREPYVKKMQQYYNDLYANDFTKTKITRPVNTPSNVDGWIGSITAPTLVNQNGQISGGGGYYLPTYHYGENSNGTNKGGFDATYNPYAADPSGYYVIGNNTYKDDQGNIITDQNELKKHIIGYNSLINSSTTANTTTTPVNRMGGRYKRYVMGGGYVGGQAVPLSSDGVAYEGDLHEQDTNKDGMGGITLMENGQPQMEVQGGESAKNVDTGLNIYSDDIFIGNKSIADIHKPIAAKKGKLEKMRSSEFSNSYSGIDKNTRDVIGEKIAHLDSIENQLFQYQEQYKANQEQSGVMRMGGRYCRYPLGGPYPGPFTTTWNPLADWANKNQDKINSNYLRNTKIDPNNPADPGFTTLDNPLGMNSVEGLVNAGPDAFNKKAEYEFTGGLNGTSDPVKDESVSGSTVNMNNGTNPLGYGVQFLDNIANSVITATRSQVPTPAYVTPMQGPTKYNINPQLRSLSAYSRSMKDNIDNTTSDAATARSNKMAVNAQVLDNVGKLYAQKENAENMMKMQNTQNAQNVNAANTQITNQTNQSRYMRDWAIGDELSANFANAASDAANMTAEENQMNLDKEKLKIYSKAFDETGVFNDNMLDTREYQNLMATDKEFAMGILRNLKSTGRDTTKGLNLYNQIYGTSLKPEDIK